MKEKILIIDDDPDFGASLSLLLRAKGYDVLVVTSGLEGVSEFVNNGARVLITDLIMPGTPGLDVIRQIRQINSGVLIIGMSGGASLGPSGSGRPAAQAGADIYLSKPFKGNELIEILEDLLKPDHRASAATAFLGIGSPDDGRQSAENGQDRENGGHHT